jgi:predicted nuclease with TOPRIM domain
MDHLDIINANLNLVSAVQSMQISLQEIKDKRPESVYIAGLEKHIKQLTHSMAVFNQLQTRNKLLSQMNFNYHKENMELKYENEQLKNKVNNLMDGI